jgi:hypothetical protein
VTVIRSLLCQLKPPKDPENLEPLRETFAEPEGAFGLANRYEAVNDLIPEPASDTLPLNDATVGDRSQNVA